MPQTRRQSANRRNAQKSTGPVTDRGKAASSLNALCHGLSAKVIPYPETEARIDALAKKFVGAGRRDHMAMNLAREAAEAQIQMHGIQSLKKHAWGPNTSDVSIENRGGLRDLHQLYSDKEFRTRFRYSKALLRKLTPYLFEEPLISEAERKTAFDMAAARRLNGLIRYERQYANRRDRALRALTEHLA